MKTLPIILACLSMAQPAIDFKVGRLIESNKYNNVYILSEGKILREDITIKVTGGDEEIIVEPINNVGYSPSLFIANFLNNGLEQVLYSLDTGGSGGYSTYELYSFADAKAKLVFNSDSFNPKITASYENDKVAIDYEGKKLYISVADKETSKEDYSLTVTGVNAILPYYNIALDRYYLQVLQRVYGGYSANTYGYITSLVQVNEDGYKIINVGTLENFEQ